MGANIYTMPIGGMWSAAVRDDRYSYTAPGSSHEAALSNLEGKLCERLREIEAEADWIRMALSEKFPINTPI
jgi:hypothetical protein